jgi:phage baseplate assembly protein V
MSPADLSRLLAPVYRRMMLAVGRAVLRQVDDAGEMQRVQVTLLSEETRDEVERMQGYGFTAVPLPGAELIVVSVGGNRDNPVAIALDDRRFRPRGLLPGEVCLYSRRTDQRVTLKADGTVLIQAPIVRIEAPLTEIAGDLVVTGEVTATTLTEGSP